ncbi:MAG: anaerobic selenocysteine-containing dehydrogenase, partial [Candidatus Paceibacteria bacterium]
AGNPIRVVDIWRTETVEAVERWGGRGVIIHPGTDSVLALAITRYAFEQGLADRGFLESECLGAVEFEEHLRGAPTIAEAARVCGLEEEQVLDLARVLEGAQKLFLRTGSGWTRRTNGAMGMRAVCSMAAVFGKADRVHYESAGVFQFDSSLIARPDLRAETAPPLLTQVALGKELEAGRFRAVFVWGHNPALTLPDSRRVREGFLREDLFLVVHEQFMTASAELADVVLPATMFVEHSDVYRSYGHRMAQWGRRAVEPPAGPLSNVHAFSKIAQALGLPSATWDVTEDGLCEELVAGLKAHLTPEQEAKLRAGKPTEMEPPVGSRQRATGGRWLTPSGKVELVSSLAVAAGKPAMATWCVDPGVDAKRAFWLISAPSKHTHNTTYLNHPRHAKRNASPRCFLTPEDMAELGVVDGDLVTLYNDYGQLTLTAEGDERMARGCARVDGFPRPADVPERTSINVLAAPDVSDLGNGTTYFSTRVDVRPAAPA